MPQQRLVRRVVDQVADACVLHQQSRLARRRVEPHQIAPGVVVSGVEQRPRPGIPRERRHGVNRGPLDRDDSVDGARVDANAADVADDAGVVEGSEDRLRRGIVVGPRDRPERTIGDVVVRRHRELADRREIGLLKLVLVLDPVRPRIVQAHAEDVPELRGVVRAAALAPRGPLDQLLGRVVAREPRHEARAVEIRVGLELEVDLGAFRDQSQRVVERRVVGDHRAEDHLVVPALRASEPAGHPGVAEDGDAFVIPARRRHPRRRQVEVQNRLRLLRDRQHLSAEQLPEEPVAPRGLVHRRDVDELVVHQRVHPLVGGDGLVDERDGRDLHRDQIARHGGRAGVPLVRQIDEQYRADPSSDRSRRCSSGTSAS